MTHPALLPTDEFDSRLAGLVHPADWTNPTPSGRYNLVVIGAGTAGLVTAAGAAGLGAKVALIERDLMGGDCLNVGCVPSKALISSARAAAAVRSASQFGVSVPGEPQVDFGAVMQRLRRLRSEIAPNDSAARFTSLGVDVFLGSGVFTGHDSIEVAGQTLRFKRAVIATGARATRPNILGLGDAGFLTNETVFSLTELPPRLAVIGGGPIGCELAQSFARLGSKVTLIERSRQLLGREDEDAARLVRAALERDGVRVLFQTYVARVQPGEAGPGPRPTRKLSLLSNSDDTPEFVPRADGRIGTEIAAGTEITVDEILVGAGRSPNVEGLNLERVGVAYDEVKGVTVDDRLRTTNRRIFAAGDVCSRFKFTHAADFMARIVIQNALFFGRARASALTIPWCTYTSPEVAHVGLTERSAREAGVPIQTFIQPFEHVDRAVLEGTSEGFVKIHVRKGSDRIVGATIVAGHAGEMIGELVLAMTHRIGLGQLARTIHPYPTVAEAIRKCGDSFNKTRLTPFVKGLFERWLAWTR
jgi:pyruvate/2-oxoglutarate dehydrogenase complex dihydrolipoamide dehydrogenase (E3) component